jgi:hypothetical protein
MFLSSRIVLLLALAMLLAAARQAPAAPTYADPAASWDKAGLRDTPPTPVATVSVRDYGATGYGETDDTAAFEAAMSALAKPGVLRIPAGTYRLRRTLSLASGVVLRGDGAQKSLLVFDLGGASDPCLDFTTYNSRSWTNFTADTALGATSITVASAKYMTAGAWVEIEQQNDPARMYTDPEWDQDWAQSVVGQFARVVSVSGTTVTLDRPLRIDFTRALTARARVYSMGQNVGIEDLGLRREDAGSGGETIHFKYAANCWVRRVESLYTVSAHVYAESSAAIEVTDSTFKYSHDYGDGGRGYGVSLGRHVSDCLVQNNVFETLRHAMIVSQGANGNVFGYNFSTIRKCETTAWTPCDISLHGHFPFRNLFEGNMVEEIDITDYWGPAGPGNVLLRNIVSQEGIEIMDASHGQVAIANLILAGGPLTVEKGITGTVLSGNVLVPQTTNTVETTLPEGPNSLYLAGEPSFFTGCSWPMLSCQAALNPAGMRYAGKTGTVEPPKKVFPAQAIFTLLLPSQ